MSKYILYVLSRQFSFVVATSTRRFVFTINIFNFSWCVMIIFEFFKYLLLNLILKTKYKFFYTKLEFFKFYFSFTKVIKYYYFLKFSSILKNKGRSGNFLKKLLFAMHGTLPRLFLSIGSAGRQPPNLEFCGRNCCTCCPIDNHHICYWAPMT